METYIVTFSIDKAKNLKEKFEAVVDGLTRLGQEKGSSALALTKTTWGLRSKRNKDNTSSVYGDVYLEVTTCPVRFAMSFLDLYIS